MMARRSRSRREFLRDVVVLSGGTLLLGACSSSPAARPNSKAGLPDVEGATLITDSAEYPKAFKEAPEFAKLVAEGKLPPVAERIGKDPLVLRPLDSVGKYGGQIRRGFIGQGDFQNAVRFCSGPDSLLYWDYQFEKVVPNIAKDFKLSDGDKVLTVHLREGMRWSDGHPFTADDILFWRQDVSLAPELGSGAAALRIGGAEVAVEKIDDLTVRFVSKEPNPLLPQRLAGWTDIGGMVATSHLSGGGFLPRHYLSQFHVKYNSGANAAATGAGFSGWALYFKNRASWHLNSELPVLTPWAVSRPISNPPWEFSANPYSIWVDNEGNQLPYVGKITMGNVENSEVLGLRAASGEYDTQDRHLGVTNLPVLLENEKRGDYTIHRAPGSEMDCGIRFNLAYADDPVLGDLLRTTDFRRALALALDREQINESFFLGTSVISATVPAEGSPYDLGPDWRTKWATHDAKQANALLDKIGLTKGSDGYRVRPDGGGRIILDYHATATITFADFVGVGEMIKRQWQEIGIDLNIQQVDANLMTQRALANQLMLAGHQVGTDDPFLKGDTFLPTVTSGFPGMIGIPYAKWFASGGKGGTEPPASLSKLTDAMELYENGLSETDEAERVRIGKELFKLHADEVWTIGICGFGLASNGVYLTSNKLKNVPARVVNSLQVKSVTNTYPMTFYYA